MAKVEPRLVERTIREKCHMRKSKLGVRDREEQIGGKWKLEEVVDVCRSRLEAGLGTGARRGTSLCLRLCQSQSSSQQTVSRGPPASPLGSTFGKN